MDVSTRVKAELSALCNRDYAAFTARLIPNIDPDRILGVRMPLLRNYAKAFRSDPDCDAFLSALPHRYQEENLLHALLLSALPDGFDTVLPRIEAFLPFIDNWAVTDSFTPCCFADAPEKTYAFCLRCLDSDHPYTVRFGIVTMLYRFLQEGFDPAVLPRLAKLPAGEYYVDMAVAWYLSQALAFQYDAVLPMLTQNRFPRFVHNKAIQKAVESCRIPAEHKAQLRTLRRPAAPSARKDPRP